MCSCGSSALAELPVSTSAELITGLDEADSISTHSVTCILQGNRFTRFGVRQMNELAILIGLVSDAGHKVDS